MILVGWMGEPVEREGPHDNQGHAYTQPFGDFHAIGEVHFLRDVGAVITNIARQFTSSQEPIFMDAARFAGRAMKFAPGVEYEVPPSMRQNPFRVSVFFFSGPGVARQAVQPRASGHNPVGIGEALVAGYPCVGGYNPPEIGEHDITESSMEEIPMCVRACPRMPT